MDPEGTDSRTDRAWRGRGFRSWIAHHDPTHGGVPPVAGAQLAVDFCIEHFGELPRRHDFKTVADFIRRKMRPRVGEESAKRYDEMIRSLAVAEAEWRSEMLAQNRLKVDALMVSAPADANRLSHRMPQVDDVCGFRYRTGRPCKKLAIPGGSRCVQHGGALVDMETRRAFLLSAYCSVVEASQSAVDALVEVATKGRNELARVAAAKEILDRAGLNPALNVNVTIAGQESDQLKTLRDKLDRIQRNLAATTIDASSVEVFDSDDRAIGDA